MTDALVHLGDYPGGKLDPADAEAVESLITLYLDGTLAPDVADQVTATIEADAALAAIVDDARQGKAWIDDVFAPESRRLMAAPASATTMDFVHQLVSGEKAAVSEEATVVPLRIGTTPRRWLPWLMAASIAGVLMAGGVAVYQVQNRFDQAASRQQALAQQIEQLTTERDRNTSRLAALDAEIADLERQRSAAEETRTVTTAELADASRTIETLQDRQGGLEQQVTALQSELTTASDQAERLEQQRVLLASDIDQLQAALNATATEREQTVTTLAERTQAIDDLQAQVRGLGTELTAAEDARGTSIAQLAKEEGKVIALESDRADLQQRLAVLALQAQTVASTLDARDHQLAGLEQALTAAQSATNETRDQIAQLAIERRALDAELTEFRAGQDWLPQVAQYHAFYARLPPRRWVEESPEDQEKLDNLLADLGQTLGLADPLPLPERLKDLAFAGGRPLPVNGMPVVQLAYVDPNDQLFAFCFMRNPSGEIKDAKPRRIGDLTLISWSDATFQYVAIGYEPLAFIGRIASQLQESYRLDT